jgi:hypothetical protein
MYEKKITNKLLHEKRIKLAFQTDEEINREVDSFRKRFYQYFKVRRLDWMTTTLCDRDKLRAYKNMHVRPVG